MEPITMFASAVGIICACHLISTTAERFGKGIYYSGNKQAKREDWYCFFQPADLTGVRSSDEKQQVVEDNQRLDQRRRQQANRPRLNV